MPEEQGGEAKRTSVWQEQPRMACGVQGCLFGSVALFVVLMVGMLILVMVRFGSPS